ncbi:Cytosolic sulfotransferase 15 [Bienertia sinuspersici]
MESLEPTNKKDQEQLVDEIKHTKDAWFNHPMHLYEGFWCGDTIFKGVIAFQSQFEAHDSDIILASMMKTGTTWVKSLIFTIVNRKKFPGNISEHPLHIKNPHELVPHLEVKFSNADQPDLSNVSSPRLFAVHMPYLSLPTSIKTSKCQIVYVCRNPLDTFVSLWHFFLQFEENKGIVPDMDLMEEYVSKYCNEIIPFGPLKDHLLGYWEESMKNPQKVLFLEYEGLKKEPKANLKRLAEFLGFPFSEEEEKGNVIDDVIELCSLKSLKEMEVNKSGKVYPWFENKALFRKGEVGDWTNHLTPTMAKRIDAMREKLTEVGFSFTYYKTNVKAEVPH